MCVAMAGDWSAVMAGRKTVKDNVKVRTIQNDLKTGFNPRVKDLFQIYDVMSTNV